MNNKLRIFLEEISIDIESELKGLDSVVGCFFCGSAANMELMFDFEGNLLSDIEIGVVVKLPYQRRIINNKFDKLSSKFAVSFDHFLVLKHRLKKGLHKNQNILEHTHTIFSYEISRKAKWIFKKEHIVLKDISVKDIPIWEGLRLFLNRVCEGAPILYPFLFDNLIINKSKLLRWKNKTLIAIGDSLLLTHRLFAPSYKEKSEIWERYYRYVGLNDKEYDAILTSYKLRDGSIKDLKYIDLNYHEVKNLFEKYLKIIIPYVFPNSKEENYYNAGKIRKVFNRNRIPTIYKIGIYHLDIQYDNLFRIKRIIKNREYFIKLIRMGWRINQSIQHLGYSYIIDFMINDYLKTESKNELEYIKSIRVFKNGQDINNWWKWYCK